MKNRNHNNMNYPPIEPFEPLKPQEYHVKYDPFPWGRFSAQEVDFVEDEFSVRKLCEMVAASKSGISVDDIYLQDANGYDGEYNLVIETKIVNQNYEKECAKYLIQMKKYAEEEAAWKISVAEYEANIKKDKEKEKRAKIEKLKKQLAELENS